MKSVSLNAFPRVLGRRGGSKKLRSSGRVPAVIYGRKAQPQNLEVSAEELGDLMQHAASENLLVDLAVKDDARPKRLALVKEIQHHALSGKVIHVDFHEIAEDEKVIVMIPVETVGESEGVKTEGGVLEHVLFSVKARGMAKDLPEQIVVDVSPLKIGQSIHLGDIKVPAGVELVGEKTVTVISVALPRSEEEEAAEAAEAATAVLGEVEMIKEKKEGEEEAPAAKGAEKGAAKGAEKGAAKGAEKGAAKGAEKAGAKPGEKAAPAAAEKKAPGEKKK
jgi:large subunit ribosomal protein L25